MRNSTLSVNTNQTRLYDVCSEIIGGHWRIPVFQRDYCWTSDNINELIDSASRGWPIGNLLLVEARGFLKDVPLKPKFTTELVDDRTYHLVIDGAQRCETMYKLFATMEYMWLVDIRDGKSFSLPKAEAIELCDRVPFIFNYSRYMSPYYLKDSKWGNNMPKSDLDQIPPAWRNEQFDEYRRSYRSRLLALAVDDSEREILKACEVAPRRSSIRYKEPPRWSAAVEREMTRAEHQARREAYNKAVAEQNAANLEWDKKYANLFEQLEQLKVKYLAKYDPVFDHIEDLNSSYIGSTTIRFERRNQLTPTELVEYFRRYNVAGVPVDIDYLKKLAESNGEL